MVLHCLEHSYRLAELLSHFGVFDGDVERSSHSADHLRYQRGRGDIKRLRQAGRFADLFGRRIFKVPGRKLSVLSPSTPCRSSPLPSFFSPPKTAPSPPP